MGTPDFAVPTLDAIISAGYDVVGVITSPDKPVGRGKSKINESPVKKYAQANGLHIMQPTNLKNAEFQTHLKSLGAELQVVVAFRMLPETVWNMPPLGTINLHGSLLPKFRGAAPIHWAVASGERQTGLTTFKLRHEIDTGSIIAHDVCMIPQDATTGDMHDKMMYTGAHLMIRTLKALEGENVEFIQQDETKVTHAPKVYHNKCELNLDQTAKILHKFILGMSPFPGAWMTFKGKKLKLLRASLSDSEGEIGSLVKNVNGLPELICKEGSILLRELQLAGKPKVDGHSFANGYL